jgi:hypothetical protein
VCPAFCVTDYKVQGKTLSIAVLDLRGHMTVFPQDPGPLLSILPSSDLRLNEVIKVFWTGKSLSSMADLVPVQRVRKDKVWHLCVSSFSKTNCTKALGLITPS